MFSDLKIPSGLRSLEFPKVDHRISSLSRWEKTLLAGCALTDSVLLFMLTADLLLLLQLAVHAGI